MQAFCESPSKRKVPYPLLGFIAYFCLISIGSSIPGQAIAELGFDIWDKALHTVEYFPLGLLAVLALSRPPFKLKRVAVMAAGPLLVMALGIVDELHQWFVPGRFSSASDAAADALGGFLGVFIGILLDQFWRRRSCR